MRTIVVLYFKTQKISLNLRIKRSSSLVAKEPFAAYSKFPDSSFPRS